MSVALFVLGWDCLLSLAISGNFVAIGVVRMWLMVFLRRQKFGLSHFFFLQCMLVFGPVQAFYFSDRLIPE
jgi:hypothetical protein